ncbi:hypothetical protein HYU17_01355 [Candidatus Woesearchaeota archaeon]|nr:hypothetical protein [Candidatus Woesearchaeota archaeon]
MKMGLLVKTNIAALVKEISKARGSQVNNVADDFLPAAEERVKKIVEAAVERAKANNRRTLMGRDL